MKRQTDAIWELMLAGWVSPLLALEKAGCMRLAARIHDLRRSSIEVEERWVEEGGKRWKEYRLPKATVDRWFGRAA